MLLAILLWENITQFLSLLSWFIYTKGLHRERDERFTSATIIPTPVIPLQQLFKCFLARFQVSLLQAVREERKRAQGLAQRLVPRPPPVWAARPVVVARIVVKLFIYFSFKILCSYFSSSLLRSPLKCFVNTHVNSEQLFCNKQFVIKSEFLWLMIPRFMSTLLPSRPFLCQKILQAAWRIAYPIFDIGFIC